MNETDDFVVHFYESWIENNCFYIRLELCSDNLKNVIQQKSDYFKRNPNQAMNLSEYFISCHLFTELLECVQYLHESNPPIIHRDLKPANVVVNKIPFKGRFLKLCDFGLAKCDSLITISHTRGRGTEKYMAPEVKNGTHYNFKSDIYSLGVIAMDLYSFDISE